MDESTQTGPQVGTSYDNDNAESDHKSKERDPTNSGPHSPENSEHSTNSLSANANIIEQIEENGRGYANESYILPCDEAEQTRLSIGHQCFISILGGQLSLQSIPRSAKRILDIGTGTGDWAIAVAERFPNAEVIATDIACIQPSGVPPNLFFEIDDAREEWTYSEPFDFIHIRGLSGAFSSWATIYAEAHKHLKPNGILEVGDFGVMRLAEGVPDSFVTIFNGACLSAAEKAGTMLGLDHLKRPLLEAAGFSIGKIRSFEVPLGTWSPDPRKRVAGKMALIATLEGLEAFGLRLFTRELGWKPEDVKNICSKAQEEMMRPEARASVPCQFIVARKLMI
ncbi:MAG: hypothetical protein Q9214_004949 [Letrouitia sp. 1 TL-2023]